MTTRKPFKNHRIFVLLPAGCLLLLLLMTTGFGKIPEKLPFDEVHIERIRELSRLTSRLGDRLWPGFDFNKIPFVMNVLNKWDVFIRHPNPPEDCRVLNEHKVNGAPIMICDGCTMLLTKSSGTAPPIGGVECAYVSTLDESQTGRPLGRVSIAAGRARDTIPAKSQNPRKTKKFTPFRKTEEYLSIALHESFHVFQEEILKKPAGPIEQPPIYDGEQAGMYALENTILHEAIKQKDPKKLEKLARMFTAVRSRRSGKLSAAVRNHEEYQSLGEGTAMYIEVRLFQLLAKEPLFESPLIETDPYYNGFRESDKFVRHHIDRLLPADDLPITLNNHIYQNGMGQAFLLDRVRPGWKKELGEKGISLFKLLQRQFPLDEQEMAKLESEAGQRFDYPKLLNRQENLIAAYLSTVRGFLEAKGRRYRIYHSDIKARSHKWSRFPYYFLFPRLLDKKDSKYDTPIVLVYTRGIEYFEKGDLIFKSKEVPVIYRLDYLEWIDPRPAADFSDLTITSSKQRKNVYHDLILTSGGFTLSAKRARIEKSQDLVAIHPISDSKRKSKKQRDKSK